MADQSRHHLSSQGRSRDIFIAGEIVAVHPSNPAITQPKAAAPALPAVGADAPPSLESAPGGEHDAMADSTAALEAAPVPDLTIPAAIQAGTTAPPATATAITAATSPAGGPSSSSEAAAPTQAEADLEAAASSAHAVAASSDTLLAMETGEASPSAAAPPGPPRPPPPPSRFGICPFQCLEVEWHPDHPLQPPKPTRVSPWEVTDLDHPEDLPLYSAPVLGEEGSSELKRVVNRLSEDQWFQDFVPPVDFTEFPAYATMVALPMELSLVMARLEQGYYRSLEGAEADLRLIMENCKEFNKAGSEIYKAGVKFGQSAIQAVQRVKNMRARREGRGVKRSDYHQPQAHQQEEQQQQQQQQQRQQQQHEEGERLGRGARNRGRFGGYRRRYGESEDEEEEEVSRRRMPQRHARIEGESQRKKVTDILRHREDYGLELSEVRGAHCGVEVDRIERYSCSFVRLTARFTSSGASPLSTQPFPPFPPLAG